MAMQDDIIDLQTRVVFQDGVIEELNQAALRQQQQIDALHQQVERLNTRLEVFQQEAMEPPDQEPPPPHY